MVRRHALLLFVLLAGSGCAGTPFSKIFHPGSAEYQAAQAERFDPYPLPDIAPDVQWRPARSTEGAEGENRTNCDRGPDVEDRFGQQPPPGTYRVPRDNSMRQTIPFVPGPPPQEAPPFVPQ